MRIFLGFDHRFPEPALVLSYSLRRRTRLALDIRFLDIQHLRRCYGFNRVHDPLASTEFTYSRFLVPYLCGYDGAALFLDNDMLCLADIGTILDGTTAASAFPGDKTLWCVQHDYRPTATVKMYGCAQTVYPRKNWSSLMLMDCSKLRAWTKDVVETAPGARLHRFQDIPDEEIGAIDPVWNDLDHYGTKTKLIHWTSGCVWNDSGKTWPHQELWLREREEWWYDEGRHFLPARAS